MQPGNLLTDSTCVSTVKGLKEEGVPQARKRLYLDVCTLCRPYDDQTGLRVRLETDAYYLILTHAAAGRYELVVSPVHAVEVASIPEASERVEVQQLLRRVGSHVSCSSPEVRRRAEELTQMRIGVADAAHVAYAEAGADVFVTSDIRLVKECRRACVRIPVCTPVDFVTREGLR